jgi:hypothetical protein
MKIERGVVLGPQPVRHVDRCLSAQAARSISQGKNRVNTEFRVDSALFWRASCVKSARTHRLRSGLGWIPACRSTCAGPAPLTRGRVRWLPRDQHVNAVSKPGCRHENLGRGSTRICPAEGFEATSRVIVARRIVSSRHGTGQAMADSESCTRAIMTQADFFGMFRERKPMSLEAVSEPS